MLLRNNTLFTLLIIQLCTIFSYAHGKATFLLIMGPSGVGKSTIIHHLKKLDERFEYITPFTTRSLREGETEKIHVSLDEIKALDEAGKLLAVNTMYTVYYATPKYMIDELLLAQKFPILDWPIQKINTMYAHYRDQLYRVYLEPDNMDELKRRLSCDGRDKDNERYNAGLQEMNDLAVGMYDNDIDLRVMNKKGSAQEIALYIYNNFIDYINS